MMINQIGYSLVNEAGAEVAYWGDTAGQCEGLPDMIQLPNGDRVHCPKSGALGVWRLVPRVMINGPEAKTAFDGSVVTVTKIVTDQNVIDERTRRMALGFVHDFQDSRGMHSIGTTPADMMGWNDVDKSVNAMALLGLMDQHFQIITNTGLVSITPIDWAKITLTATGFRTPIWLKSFALQAMTPIPADFANDVYWS